MAARRASSVASGKSNSEYRRPDSAEMRVSAPRALSPARRGTTIADSSPSSRVDVQMLVVDGAGDEHVVGDLRNQLRLARPYHVR